MESFWGLYEQHLTWTKSTKRIQIGTLRNMHRRLSFGGDLHGFRNDSLEG